MYLKAQDDPQEIADIACAYGGAVYEFNSVEAYIESPNYPNYYVSGEECRWYINPTGGIPPGQVSNSPYPRKYLNLLYYISVKMKVWQDEIRPLSGLKESLHWRIV